MRGVYVGGNERNRECRECFLFFFYLLQYVFLREIKKGGVNMGLVMGKN